MKAITNRVMERTVVLAVSEMPSTSHDRRR